jgi:iron(III) transport system substrate-binding protein
MRHARELRLGALTAFAMFCGLMAGCRKNTSGPAASVVLYTSVDEPYARPLIEQFERESGIHVTLITDSEASKSVGLAEKLRAEKANPQADVWWDNECFLAINLADEGILAPYDSPSAADIPSQYKDPGRRWAGSVLRVRMMISAPPGPSPQPGWAKPARLRDLLRPDLKGQIALARPTAGTTGGQMAAIYVLWGKDRAEQFFHGLHDNGVKLVGGNSVVADLVGRGSERAGLCDNDDAADAAASGSKLDATLPDQGDGEDGTLAMPCAVGLVTGGPNPDAARRLIDFLLSREADEQLIAAKFAWCSSRDGAGKGKFMVVDYDDVAKAMPTAIRSATEIIEGRND